MKENNNIGKSVETFELTFNEDFKSNTELEKQLSSDELIKVVEEFIMNSNIPEWNREVKIYMGPKQWEMFNKAILECLNEHDRRNTTNTEN